MKIMTNGAEQVSYQDFTVFNIRTGKITFWEHAEKMDDSSYANDFVPKINLYQANAIMPGKSLLTYPG